MAIVSQFRLREERMAESCRVLHGMTLGRLTEGDLILLAAGWHPRFRGIRVAKSWRPMAQAELDRRARLEA